VVTADLGELRTVLSDAGNDAPIPDQDEARWTEAKQLRRERPGWLIIWIARINRFHGYQLKDNRSGTNLSAPDIDDLAAQIDQAERAARWPRGRSAAPSRNGQASEPGTAAADQP